MRPLLLSLLFAILTPTLASVLYHRSDVCDQISSSITGGVYYDASINFIDDNEHYMSSSEQTPMCVVEVASPKDISTVIKIVAATKTPFAVKSGGHASNPGFSSTPGVFISLVRLNQVTLSEDKSTVEVGTGNVSSFLRYIFCYQLDTDMRLVMV